jgi:hypothetical protein
MIVKNASSCLRDTALVFMNITGFSPTGPRAMDYRSRKIINDLQILSNAREEVKLQWEMVPSSHSFYISVDPG